MRRRTLLIGVAALAALVAIVWGGYATYVDFNRVEEAQHVPRVDWLPRGATDVSYYRAYSWTAYEFDIDEAGFLRWAKDEGWPVKRVDKPFTVPRHSFEAARRMYPRDDDDMPAKEYQAAYDAARTASEKVITRGYGYERRQSNGGGVTVGYDLDAGRAYYQSSPR
jgi:hypothetical protein